MSEKYITVENLKRFLKNADKRYSSVKNNASQDANGLMSKEDKIKLDNIEANANNYVLPTASSTLGGVKTTSTVTSTSGLTACPIISGVPYYKDTNTRYSPFVKSGSSSASGLVPEPPKTQGDTRYLCEDGTWKEIDIDSAVHKTGNETIDGTKTFTSQIVGSIDKAEKDLNGNIITSTYATKSEIPTKVSDLTNDSNFISSTNLSKVATSGSYNDLSNKPTIPTVNNATLTIQKNGTTVKTFTANSSTNVTCNITVPTKVSDLTNDSGFIADVSGKADKATTLSGYGITDAYTKTQVDKKVSDLVNSAPETLDTLNELASALGNDPNFATTVANQIGTKANNSDVVHKNIDEIITSKKIIQTSAGHFDWSVPSWEMGTIPETDQSNANMWVYDKNTYMFYTQVWNRADGSVLHRTGVRNKFKDDVLDPTGTIKDNYFDVVINKDSNSYIQWSSGKVNNPIFPLTNNTFNLGTSTNKWKDVYATTFHGNLVGNADTATKATSNASGNELSNNIIKGLSVSGRTITYTKLDGSTGTITTQDTNTTYSSMSAAEATTGTATTARTITAKVLNDKIDEKIGNFETKSNAITGLSVSGKVITYTKGDGSTGTITTQDTNTWTAFKGATSSANGTAGYVPAPTKGNQNKFFRADGTWATPTKVNYANSAAYAERSMNNGPFYISGYQIYVG